MATHDVLSRALPPAQAEVAIQLLEERESGKLALFLSEIEDITRAWTRDVPKTTKEAASLTELLARAKVAHEELESMRKERVRPLIAEKASIDTLFKTVTDPLDSLITAGKRAYNAWTAAERARVEREEAERRRAMEAAALKEQEALARAEAAKTDAARKKALADAEKASQAQAAALVQAPAPAARGIRTDTGTVSSREVWKFEIVKPELVPRQYLEVSDGLIRTAVRSGVRQIPGVNIFPEDQAQIRLGVGGKPF